MASVVAAIASGADIVEVDIRATRDGRVVLTHDDSILLSEGASGRIDALGWARIEAASRAGGEQVLCLEDLLDAVPADACVLNLDAKDHGALTAAAEVVRSRRREDGVFFSGLDESGIQLARERLPDFRYLFNADHCFEKNPGMDGMIAACRTALRYSCCGINLNWRLADSAMMEYARKRCIPVMLWTVDDTQAMMSNLLFGPYSITTNRPDILNSLLN
jgi:glycerophosphoryl diester phosphodiesterase